MAAKLIPPTESMEVHQLCALVYGQPGSRKTSLAQTADDPITFAFDPGVYRAYGRKSAVLFDSWADVLAFDTKPYKTIVIDTIGMCLEKLTAAIIDDNPKNGNRLGGLTLPGYGVLKSQFAQWVAGVRQRGLDIVFVAHEKAEKNGDDAYYCPDIVGGSYGTLMNHCDIVGYMHFERGKRVVDFAPTDRWMAKTPPCNWTQIVLPDFKDEPNFLSKLLAEAKASMGRISEASAQIASMVAEWQDWLKTQPDTETLNAKLPEMASMDKAAKTQVWSLIENYAKAGKLSFDKKAKAFVQEGA